MTAGPVPENLPPEQLIGWACERFGKEFAIVTSFQAEGMALMDMAVRVLPSIRVVTLDTGRLPPETYEIMEEVRSRYGITIETVSPDTAEVESMVTRFGPNLFYQEVAFRNLCCEIRKVRPLERKLKEFKAWAVGLRRGQSAERESVLKVEETGGRWKLSPLADWSKDQVEEYLRAHNVPRHPLYAKGYTSIGCAPCTRATREGEDERAGRWWWEQEAAKECGIHFSPDGRVERRVDVLLQEVLQARNA